MILYFSYIQIRHRRKAVLGQACDASLNITALADSVRQQYIGFFVSCGPTYRCKVIIEQAQRYHSTERSSHRTQLALRDGSRQASRPQTDKEHLGKRLNDVAKAEKGVSSHNEQVLWEACSKHLITLDFELTAVV
jgi:hypothetical protein